ncbi:MAG: amidohydrolase [Bdellovibrionaceae bacterium]|nr:amidohydrolase [Bdellovibrio sp.]
MLKIDIHTHILPPSLPDFKKMFGYGGFMTLEQMQDHSGCQYCNMISDNGKFFRRVEKNCFESTVRISEYETQGVQVQVLSTVPVMFSYWAKPDDGLVVARFLNDHIAGEVKKYPKNFIGLGTLPMQSPELAIVEARRAVKDLGLHGFQIGSHINDWNLSDPNLFPVFAELEKLGASLFVHPWEMMGQDRMPKYWLPWLVGMPAETSLAICSMIFGGVFEKFPKLRVAFAHGGGSFPFTLGRIQHGFDSRPDFVAIDCKTPPKDFVGKFWVDSLVHDLKSLKFLIGVIGAKKIALGTDYPFPLGELQAGNLIESANFDTETKEWLFNKSALEWLNIKPEFFERLS